MTFGEKALIHIWDVQRPAGTPANVLYHGSMGLPIVFSPDGRRLAFAQRAYRTCQVTILDLETRGKVLVDADACPFPERMSFSPDGKRLAVISTREKERKQELLAVDTVTGNVTQLASVSKSSTPGKPEQAGGGLYRAVQMMSDGRALAIRQSYRGSLSRSRTLVTELCDGETALTTIQLPIGTLIGGAISPDGKSLALMTYQPGSGLPKPSSPVLTVRIQSIPSGTQICESRYLGNAIGVGAPDIGTLRQNGDDFRFSTDGSRLEFTYHEWVKGENGNVPVPKIVALDSRSGNELWTLKGSVFGVSRDSKLLAWAESENLIVIERLDGRVVLARYNPEAYPSLLQFAPDGRKLLSCSKDGTVQLWDVPNPK
jgi:WD40 repeat protein